MGRLSFAKLTNGGQPGLQSDVILFISTKGKGQFFTAELLYKELGVAGRSPPMSLEKFASFLEGMSSRNLLRRWKVDPMGGKGEVFTGV